MLIYKTLLAIYKYFMKMHPYQAHLTYELSIKHIFSKTGVFTISTSRPKTAMQLKFNFNYTN